MSLTAKASHSSHVHGKNCGHLAIKHQDHVDYLHDGKLHSIQGSGILEHTLEISVSNPKQCTPHHTCGGHGKEHKHGPGCGHDAISHGDHMDYLVGDHLHHTHGDHCDDHGSIQFS